MAAMNTGGPDPQPAGADGPSARANESPFPRLLVVSYLFPPDGAVGGLRWGGITKYLARDGWSVHVLAGAQAERPRVMNGVAVDSLPRATTLNDLYRRRARRRRGGAGVRSSDASTASEADDGGPGPLHRFRRGLALALRYPDYSRGWVLRAARVARRIIADEGIDIVVSSGPPHTAHVAAMLATRRTAARWVLDLRDPWSEMLRAGSPGFLAWMTRRLESAAFKTADAIVCNTRQYADALRRRPTGGRVHWIPNGIDPEGLPEPLPCRSQGPLTLAYAGTLYFNRDLGPVIAAMEELRRRSASVGREARLRFAGHADPEHSAALQEQVRRSGLDARQVEILGRVATDEARAIVQDADLAIVLAQQQPMQVPAKLYESMGLGVRTLVLAEAGSAAATEAERIGAAWREPGDVGGICDVLQLAAARGHGGSDGAAEPFDYAHVARRVAALLTAETP